MTNENSLDDDMDSAEVLTGRQIAQRIEKLLDAALSLIDCDATEAECWAYEAGRYAWESDAITPERLVAHPALAAAFERGKADVQEIHDAHMGVTAPQESKSASRPGM